MSDAMKEDETWFSATVRRFRSVVVWIVRHEFSPRTRTLVLAGSALAFVAATLVAVSRLPRMELDVRWLVPVAGLAVVSTALNAAEFVLAGRWLEVELPWRRAFSVTVMATAANLAPVPGAVLVRGRELLTKGSGAADTGRALAAIGAGWVAVALIVASVVIAIAGRPGTGAAVGLGGGLALGILLVVLPSGARRFRGLLVCVSIEAAAVGVEGTRIALALRALGYEGNLEQTLALPASGALASATGVVPGGLGLRELLAGGISPLVGLPVAQGVTATAVDRIVGMLVLSGLAAVVVVVRRRFGRDPNEDFSE